MIINNNICFIHIPKAGGSTIENLLLQNENNYFNYILLNIFEFVYDYIKMYASTLCYIFFNNYHGALKIINNYCLNKYHSTYLIQHKLYGENMKYFSCVRHPQSRLVSLYTFLKPNMRFDKFVIYILTKDLTKNKLNLYPPKISYQEQTLFLCNYKNEIVVPYIKIENINEEWHNICAKLNINDNNKSIPRKNSSCDSVKDTLSWKKYYDNYPYLINIVKNYYKNDFINFDYEIYYPNKISNKIYK